MKNTVIKNESPEMGKEIIKYFKSLGFDTGGADGSSYAGDGHDYFYYGVIDDVFDNYTLEDVEEYNSKIITLPKEESTQETTLEEVVEKLIKLSRQDAFYEGVKWHAKRSFSEEEVKTIINDIVEKHCTYFEQKLKDDVKLEWFEQFKKKEQ